MKPMQICDGEWYRKGCFIQKQSHPNLLKYHVFKDTKDQETVGTCSSFKEAIRLCNENEVINPVLGLEAFI